MSELPKGWVQTTLGEISTWGSGGTPSRSNQTYFGGEIPWVTISDLNDGIVLTSHSSITEAGLANSAAKLVPIGSIMLALYGSIGKLGIAGVQLTTNQAIAYSLPNDRAFNNKYLFFFLEAERNNLLRLGSGVTQKNIYLGDLKAYRFVLPPLAEQARIVAKLEELLSELDAGVAELRAAQRKLGQYRQSLLKAAVEGALTATWRAQNPPTETGAELLQRILKERRERWEAKQLAKFHEQGKTPPKDWQKKYPEPTQPDTTNLPELPEGWVWGSVEQLGCVQLGRQRSPNKIGKANPTPYIRAANITEAGIDLTDVLEMEFSESEKEKFALKVGDVLLTEASGSPEHVGRPAIWKHDEGLFCFQNTVLRFTPEGIGSEYAFIAFLAMQKLGVFSRLSGGVGINHLSAGKFSKLPVPLPPVVEQLAVVKLVSDGFSQCDEQLASNKYSLKQAAAQRQNILRAAFAGELVAQDPEDEPANVLLERIRTERAAQENAKKPRGRKGAG